MPFGGRFPTAFFRRLRHGPNTELHLHLEGSISTPALVALAGRSITSIFPDPAAVRVRRAELGTKGRFLDLYRDVCRCLKAPEDYGRVARDLVRRLARERITHAEVYVSPAVVERIGLPWTPVRDAVERVFARHEARGRGRILVLLDSPRQWGPEAAHSVLDRLEREPWSRAVGFGLGGDESAVPARDFADVYARVRRLALAPLVHAGEWGGPESVAEAVHWLRPVRIAHGLGAAEDPKLLRHLARSGVTLDVCPSSNIATGALPSLAEVARRVRALLAAGVRVTLSTDDPGLFGTTLYREYVALARNGLSLADLRSLAAFSREAALSPPAPARREPGTRGRSSQR